MKTDLRPRDLWLLSLQYRRAGRFEEALYCLDQLQAQYIPCHLSRAQVLSELGRFEEALLDCNEFFRIAGPVPELRAIWDDIGDRALAYYDRLLAANSKDKEAIRTRERLELLLQWPQAKAA